MRGTGIFTCVCVGHLLQGDVTWSSGWNFAWKIMKQGVAHNLTLDSKYLNFVLVSLFFRTHTTLNLSSFQ
jgi:hypothetical protein